MYVSLMTLSRLFFFFWGGGRVGEGEVPLGIFTYPELNVWSSWVKNTHSLVHPALLPTYLPTHSPTSQPYNDLETW